MKRRQLLQAGSGAAALAATGLLSGCATISAGASAPRVVIVGGGYAGATAAKYLRMFSHHSINVTLVEPNATFISCPISNLVLSGSRQMADITIPYENLVKRHGINLVRDMVTAIDAEKRQVRLSTGATLAYDRLVIAPGIDLQYETLPGLNNAAAQEKVLHAWKAGAQTVALRKQLEAMPDGGVYALSIPLAPYRCPPGPYERASVIADYFARAKPRSKVLILDANDDVTSKGGLFKKVWETRYKGIIEYRPKHALVDVDVATGTLKFDVQDDVSGAVLNVLPQMRAGRLAVDSGLANINKRWCEVDFLTFESKVLPNVHVLGDSIQIAPLMPKSAHMANQHGKTCAAALTALLTGKPVGDQPLYNNTCYSFVSASDAIRVSSVHLYDAEKKTMVTVPGSGGVSAAPSELEAHYAQGWANNIWADTLA